MIFFQVPLTLSPVTGRRLYYTIFSVDIGVTPKTAVSLCHFNQMFHAGDCCVFKTVFSTHRHPASTVNSPAHPVSVPIRHPGDKSSAVTSLETDTYYIYIYLVYKYSSQMQQDTRYIRGILMRVASGLFSWSMAAGLLAFSSRQFALAINHGPLSASHYL